ECLTQTGQHAKAKDVDFQDAQRVEIVLVPFDEGAIVHRRITDGDHFIETAAGDDKSTDVLGKVAREAIDLLRERKNLTHALALRIEAGPGDGLFRHRAATTTPDRG